MIAALPHVDEIVTDDAFFHNIYPIASVTGCVRAKTVRNVDFIGRF